MITTDLLKRFAPNGTKLQVHAEALELARRNSTVTTKARLCCFLGQVFVETQGFARMKENLDYRDPARLDSIFSAVHGIEDAKALIAKGEEAIANRVYANRLGNGDEASGDGFRYRGGGYKQLTGRENYRNFGKMVGVDLEEKPELARNPVTAASIAFAFWDAKHCSPLADSMDIGTITLRINGPARLGLKARRDATMAALGIWPDD